MTRVSAVGLCVCLAGCATASIGAQEQQQDAPSGSAGSDSRPVALDARVALDAPATPLADAPAPLPMPQAAKLQITEVVLQPSAGEFIEIANPGDVAVALDRYYVADTQKYPLLAAGNLTVESTDFIVGFPAGASIAPKQVITIALDSAANFQTTYGRAPTYSLASGQLRSVAQNGTPGLTNAGEMVALLYWDGASDLVKDVDLVNVGVPSSSNLAPNKTGLSVDGPDADALKTAYATDGMTLGHPATAPAANQSMKRLRVDAAHQQTAAVCNGLAGSDETTEALSQTWSTAYAAPNPGTVDFAM